MSSIHRETALVVLTILGGAAFMLLPLAVLLDRSDLGANGDALATGALVLGCALGAACAVTVMPAMSELTAAVAGALAVTVERGAMWMVAREPTGHVASLMIGAALAAGLAAFLMKQRTWQPWLTVTSGLVSLAVTVGSFFATAVAIELEAPGLLSAVPVVVGPMVAGMVSARVVPGSDYTHVVRGWFVLSALEVVAIAAVLMQPVVLAVGFLWLLVLCPFLCGLGGIGAWMVRTRRVPDTGVVPAARALG